MTQVSRPKCHGPESKLNLLFSSFAGSLGSRQIGIIPQEHDLGLNFTTRFLPILNVLVRLIINPSSLSETGSRENETG
jgi:hypothetical protein